jgi:hypothetical protein
MSRTLAGVLAGITILAVAGVAGAGIPDPTLSFVTIDNGGRGLATCPAGDGPEFQYVTVTAKRSDATPIEGIPSTSFFFTADGCDVTMIAEDPETNQDGEIRFKVRGDETCCCAAATLAEIYLSVRIYTVAISDSDTLYANSFDEDCDGDVDPVDFSLFAGDFPPNAYDPCSDFDYNDEITPVDFSLFSGHFGHP